MPSVYFHWGLVFAHASRYCLSSFICWSHKRLQHHPQPGKEPWCLNWRAVHVEGPEAWHVHSVWESEGMRVECHQVVISSASAPITHSIIRVSAGFHIYWIVNSTRQAISLNGLHARIPSSSHWWPFCSTWWFYISFFWFYCYHGVTSTMFKNKCPPLQ